MTDAASGIDVTGYYECRGCGFRISNLQMEECEHDYICPLCYSQRISEFKKVPDWSAA